MGYVNRAPQLSKGLTSLGTFQQRTVFVLLSITMLLLQSGTLLAPEPCPEPTLCLRFYRALQFWLKFSFEHTEFSE
jgi:hypothetical protein